MQKLSVFLFMFILNVNVIYADETSKTVLINEVLSVLETQNWIEYVRRVKNDEEIPAFLLYTAPTKLQRQVLQKYNLLQYEKGLIKELDSFLSEAELVNTLDILKKPSIIKVLNSIDYNYIPNKKLEKTTGTIHPKLKPLIISLYNILGHDSLAKIEYERYATNFDEEYKAKKVLQRNKGLAPPKKYSLNSFREFYLLSLYKRVSNLSIPELREFIRFSKTKKTFLKFNQVVLSYHYGFIAKILNDLDGNASTKRKLGLD